MLAHSGKVVGLEERFSKGTETTQELHEGLLSYPPWSQYPGHTLGIWCPGEGQQVRSPARGSDSGTLSRSILVGPLPW